MDKVTYIKLDSAPMGSAPARRAISGLIFRLISTPFIRLKYISSLSGAQIYYLKYIISNMSAQIIWVKCIIKNISVQIYHLKHMGWNISYLSKLCFNIPTKYESLQLSILPSGSEELLYQGQNFLRLLRWISGWIPIMSIKHIFDLGRLGGDY